MTAAARTGWLPVLTAAGGQRDPLAHQPCDRRRVEIGWLEAARERALSSVEKDVLLEQAARVVRASDSAH